MPSRAAPAPAPAVDRAPIGPQPKPAPQLSPEEEVRADEEQMLAHIASIHADVDTFIPRVNLVSTLLSPLYGKILSAWHGMAWPFPRHGILGK